ncbi:BglII/BstYI family type II restriction endonuclease, partial [Herbivorax sp. ANBcel31]|uniref:BglII/BstYI family type II restriction endonuclease n=1 Tax=Herbivorax sp. ANBcel31 TaxID=3069754 RepID=UPI0027ADB4CB
MTTNLIPEDINDLFEIHEWRHACAILKGAFPEEWNEIINVLRNFRLNASDIVQPGGRKSPISKKLDEQFYNLGWTEKSFDTKIVVDGNERSSPTHNVDCFKNMVALEIEWNNKDPFYDRDLNNFRLLFELHVISVGIIITRCDELQEIFNSLGKGNSYGASTTHMSKLLPRIQGGGGGGCPIIVFGISSNL